MLHLKFIRPKLAVRGLRCGAGPPTASKAHCRWSRWPEGFRAAMYGAVCGCGRYKVCGNAVSGASLGQPQTAMAVGEGDLCSQRFVLPGQAQERKHGIHSPAFCSMNIVSYMLPKISSSQVCHVPLEVAVEQERSCLASSRDCSYSISWQARSAQASARSTWKVGVQIRVPFKRRLQGRAAVQDGRL
jgi:hypothetical protein